MPDIGAKRIFDLCCASILIVLLIPVFIVVAVMIRVCLGSPVLFRHTRPGRYSAPFELIKFRTMRHATDTGGKLLADEHRLTKLGQFLRHTSLDELPELVNVVRGEMSLVGPRPLMTEYLKYYTAEENRRHDARPGITGLAQVNGRNGISWEEKFQLDVWYVDHQSFWLDLKILAKTLWIVISREGVAAEGYATMPAFVRPTPSADQPGDVQETA